MIPKTILENCGHSLRRTNPHVFPVIWLLRCLFKPDVGGLLVVDLLPDDAHDFISKFHEYYLPFVLLMTPTITDDRIPFIASAADSFVSCVRQAPRNSLRACYVAYPVAGADMRCCSVERNAVSDPHTGGAVVGLYSTLRA